MTSHLLDRLARDTPAIRAEPGDCIFCDIIERRHEAFIVAETDDYIAFLDVLPIRTELTDEEGAEVASALAKGVLRARL
ncbi:hypothetical protein MCUN1_003367 [Malassezia cuniculi]|uniref:HIT family protein n=1 Tax=Malassezia cuniculi TaxID=948313 RepID=A0AAF0F1A5_9BASI|nr:hypothetical protein MCUN1_003367 [Malassezia cuniculi]